MADLIDRHLPNFDVPERHHLVVHAPSATAYASPRTTDLARGPLIPILFHAHLARRHIA